MGRHEPRSDADRDGRKGWHRSLPWTGIVILSSRIDSLRSASARNRPRGAAAVRTTCHRRSRPKQGPRRREGGPGPRQSPAQTAMSQGASGAAPVATSGSEWSAASRFRSAPISCTIKEETSGGSEKRCPSGGEDGVGEGTRRDRGRERWERGAPVSLEKAIRNMRKRGRCIVCILASFASFALQRSTHCFSHSVHSLLPPFPFFFGIKNAQRR